ncbi:MAG: hypothetical protein R2830_11785 [Saprospiraceae bacterium]
MTFLNTCYQKLGANIENCVKNVDLIEDKNVAIEFFETLPVELNKSHLLNKFHYENESGFEIVFSMKDVSVSEILDILNERLDMSTHDNGINLSSNTTELTFFDIYSFEKSDFNPEGYVHIKEKRLNQFKQLSKAEFFVFAKEELERLLNVQENKVDVDLFSLNIKIDNHFKFIKNGESNKSFKVEKNGDSVFLYNATELDLKRYLSNRYLKAIEFEYEKCYHPLIVGNYLFDKIEINDLATFDQVRSHLKEKYQILLDEKIGEYKGLVYVNKSKAEKMDLSFTEYEIFPYRDEYIDLNLKFVPFDRRERLKRRDDTNLNEIVLTMYGLQELFEMLHLGMIKDGNSSRYSLGKKKGNYKIIYDLSPRCMALMLDAKNLKPQDIGEEEFRLRVENAILEHLGIDKKTVDYPMYECSYDLDKLKASKFCKQYINSNKDMNSNSTRIDDNNFYFNLGVKPKKSILLRPYLLGYDIIFKDKIAPDFPNQYGFIKNSSSADTVYRIENLILPQNDLPNLICILNANGLNIKESDSTERVLVYRNK